MPFLNIMALSVTAAAAITAKRGVTSAGAVPAAGASVLGFARVPAVAGDVIAVDVLGVAEAEAGAAIAAGAAVEVDSLGRVITLASGVKVGRMAPYQSAAAAAGDVVEIVLIPS